MKTMRFLILGLLATVMVCHAEITSPGWYRVGDQKLAVRPLSSFALSSQARGANAQAASPMSQFYEPQTPIAEVITPQIQALADGLQDDPVQIFNYVHDHIKFVLYFGSKKGAELTLLEKSGNDFDQCALLVALLRAAGYNNVQYQFGWQQIPYDDPYGYDYDLHHWWQLTLDNTNWNYTINYFFSLVGNRGYPGAYWVDDGLDNNFDIQRVWVALTIGSTTYQLDPAFKISEPITMLSGFSLTNAMGGSGTTISNALRTAAAGTDTGNYAQSLSEPTVRTKLTTYATNIFNYIQTNCPNASVQDISGGWQITPAYDPWDFSIYTTFPVYDFGGQMPVLSWTYEPTNMMSTFTITFAGTNYQWFMPQLQGQRLALTFDTGGLAQLWQDDTLRVQNATSGNNGTTNVVLAVTHPVGTWDTVNNVFVYNPANFANTTVTNLYQRTNATYAILYAFEPDWGWLEQRQNMLDIYLQQGLTNGSRQVTSETLNIMGLNWMLQTAQAGQMMAKQLGMLPQYFHRLGRMAQESGRGYYVDVYMQFTGEYPSGGNDAAHIQLSNVQFDLWSFFASALEHGIIEQLQNTNLVAASTVKMLQIANTNGQPIYLASSTNWTTAYNVQSHLIAYDSTTLSTISGFINQGFYVLLPQNGTNHVSSAPGSWAGYGYEARQAVNGSATYSAMIIGGGYFGGYASDPTAVVDTTYVDETSDSQPQYYDSTPVTTPAPSTADPVDTGDAAFQLQNTDLSLGQAEPRGITLSRYYNGTRRFSNPAGMAGGWIHNYYITANTVAAPQAGLGGTTPAQAASMLAATAAAIAYYNGGYPNPKNWTVTALIAKWGVDQVIKNGVSVNLGKDTIQFVKQPNGVFTPPANCTWTLAINGAGYNLQQRRGNTFKFNAAGLLTNIVDQYSQSLKLTYNASNWVATVTDWKSRSLTFNYTGSRLTSVSDGSRSVSYGYSTTYNPKGDLTSFTDAEGKTSTYVYDTNHQITATLDALSRLVVSNLYDSQGHITTQYTQGDTNKTWRIYWSGWHTAEIDPAGGWTDYFYDDQDRLTGVNDPLGYETYTYYDGQNHIIATVLPLLETNQFFYDGSNNLIRVIDPLGFTNQFIYDNKNNLIRSVDGKGNTNNFGYNTQYSLIGQTNGAGDWVTYTYNTSGTAIGTLATRVDPGGTTTFGYDSTYAQLNKITYPGSLGSEGYLNNSLGDVLSRTNARGFVTSFQYNSRRQLTNTIAPTNLTVSLSYDATGNLQSAKDARGFTTSETWSSTRLLLATTFPATPQGTPVITNIYDNRDWLMRTIQNPLSTVSATTSFTNDADRRLIAVSDPLQRPTWFGYDADGRRIATTNAAQEVTQQSWDAKSELIQLTDGAGRTVLRSYDQAGNQIILTNRNGKKWQFQFDAANRLTNTISPLNRQTSLTYDNRGLLKTVREPSGQLATNNYDAKGRLTNRLDGVVSKFLRYDANNNVTNIIESAKTNVWTYDAYDHVSTYKDADGNLIQYRYDANGNMTNLIYPGGKTVTYFYDSLNRLTNVTDWAQRKTTIGYDLASRVTSITRPNGTVRTIGYDAAGETTNIIEKTSAGNVIAFFKFNWNNAARVGWEFAAPLPHSYTPPTRNMTYDDDNRLTNFNNQAIVNDPDGNMTSGPLTNDTFTTYTYDARNRLLSAGGINYAYDPAGNRVGLTNGGVATRFVVNPNAALSQVLMRVKNGTTNYYVYGLGLLYQVTETATTTNTLTYHYDYRGSTVALTDGNGNVTDRIEYSAYGLTTYRGGTNDTPFLFNGRYGVQTDANGLLYMRARYYNPYICRFINADPSGFSGGLNFYAYADGNPVSYLDPFGLWTWGQVGSAALHFGEGVVVGAVIAGAVVVAAPVVVSGLVAVGVSATIASATVTVGLAGTAAIGTYATVVNTAQAAGTASVTGNWDAVAYNAGTLTGGFLVGASGGGQALAESISGRPTSALPGLFGDSALGYDPNYPNGSVLTWLGSGPTPQSGTGALIPTAAGAGLLFQPSGTSDASQSGWLTSPTLSIDSGSSSLNLPSSTSLSSSTGK